jgi:hypothetical protein
MALKLCGLAGVQFVGLGRDHSAIRHTVSIRQCLGALRCAAKDDRADHAGGGIENYSYPKTQAQRIYHRSAVFFRLTLQTQNPQRALMFLERTPFWIHIAKNALVKRGLCREEA